MTKLMTYDEKGTTKNNKLLNVGDYILSDSERYVRVSMESNEKPRLIPKYQEIVNIFFNTLFLAFSVYVFQRLVFKTKMLFLIFGIVFRYLFFRFLFLNY